MRGATWVLTSRNAHSYSQSQFQKTRNQLASPVKGSDTNREGYTENTTAKILQGRAVLTLENLGWSRLVRLLSRDSCDRDVQELSRRATLLCWPEHSRIS